MSAGGLARRIGITLGVPAACVVARGHLPLPGVSLGEGLGDAAANFNVLALGVVPIVTAYWFVELAAILVPRWQSLRNGAPEGRARLERASRVLAIVLALAQAFSIATSLASITRDFPGMQVSVPMVAATLAGGACLSFVLADWVTRQGLANGLVLLTCATGLRDLATNGASLASRGGLAIGGAALGAVAVAFATWAALRRPGAPRALASRPPEGSPYRDTRRLVLQPWVPVPSGSIQSYVFAINLVTAARAYFAPGAAAGGGLPPSLLPDGIFSGGAIAMTALVCAAFAHLLHRPVAIARLARSLEVTNVAEIVAGTRTALRRAFLPSMLFFVAAILATGAKVSSVVTLALTVAAAMDFASAIREGGAGRQLVPVWEERRAAALPMVRGLLGHAGIASEARGSAVLSLLQVFAPYAPATVLVAKEDAAKATDLLRATYADDEPAAREVAASPAPSPSAPWPLRTRTFALGGAAFVALVAALLGHAGAPLPAVGATRANLEVTRVDDDVDPFAEVKEAALPEGSGTTIRPMDVPVGSGRTAHRHYARVILRPGETPRAAFARVSPWLGTLRLPAGDHFGYQAVKESEDDDRRATETIGIQPLVLEGAPLLGTADVIAADAPRVKGAPPVTLVTLSTEAAARFGDATGEWTGRRIAIAVDGEVLTAPIVKTAIRGGHLSLSVPGADDEAKLANARALAARLMGR